MNFLQSLDVTVVGGGMITEMQILPSLYHLQRLGTIKDINICALNSEPLKKISENDQLINAFPGHAFNAYPDYRKEPAEQEFPDLYKEVIANMLPRNIVFIALPDQMHYQAILYALEQKQHVLCVKPLALKYEQSLEIEKKAYQKGLFVGVEYHKRFDDRVGMARIKYRNGDFGDFRLGYCTLIEPWYYRDSNFQNWCTIENSDMFTYIGCHYVDQVHMITGLLPVQVSVYGSIETYPNGNKGYLWTNGRVIWENGASLAVLNGMGYPNVAAGGNSQGIWMFTQGKTEGGLIFHDDQYRGVKHSYIHKGSEAEDSLYNEPSPDYFKYVERGGKGLTPVGYGYRSIEGLVAAVHRVEAHSTDSDAEEALKERKKKIKEIDREGIIATPANSSYNELVIEAGRMSILNGGREVGIEYGKHAGVKFV
jgi:D-galacturonate reductase